MARGTNSFIRSDDAEASTTSLLVSEQLMFEFRQHGLIEDHTLHNYAGYRTERLQIGISDIRGIFIALIVDGMDCD